MFLSVLFLVLCVSEMNGGPLDYKFSMKADGWLKLYEDKASWSDAFAQCDVDGGVLASPLTRQLRDAIGEFLMMKKFGGLWILTGVQSNFNRGDFYSIEGYPLSIMPVVTNTVEFIEDDMSESCVVWKTNKEDIFLQNCEVKREFVCYKKRTSVNHVVDCGHNTDYSYSRRSGSCYKFHQDARPWSKAYEICRREGAHLAVINNDTERVVLTELFDKYNNTEIVNEYEKTGAVDLAFMGIRNWPKDGKPWLTIKRETLAEAGFDEWRSVSDLRSARCVTMHREGKYVNVVCQAALPFICEKDPVLLKDMLIEPLSS